MATVVDKSGNSPGGVDVHIPDPHDADITIGDVLLHATATAAAPSYVEGSSDNPLSVDLDGNLRTLGSAVIEAFGDTSDTAATASDADATFMAFFKRFMSFVESTTAPSFTNLIKGMTAQMTGTTSTAVTGIGAPGASLYNYITQITVSNADDTTNTEVVLLDGDGGTAFYTIPAAHNCGGATLSFSPPLRQPTANTALFCKNLTTGASVTLSASGYKAA